MSIYPLARVWDHSRQRGSALLLLLAMADRADELGVCWAGTNWLTSRARLERRQTIRTVQQLEKAQEIIVVRSRKPNNGQNVVNHYIVSVGASPDVMASAWERVRELLAMRGSVAQDTSVVDDTREGGQDVTRGSGLDDTRVVVQVSPDPYSYPEEEEGQFFSLPVSRIWAEALSELELQTTTATFRKHFFGTTAEQDAGALVIRVRKGSDEWLAARYDEIIRRTVNQIVGRDVDIQYRIRS